MPEGYGTLFPVIVDALLGCESTRLSDVIQAHASAVRDATVSACGSSVNEYEMLDRRSERPHIM